MARRRTGNDRTALITGASSGIGEALAQRFAMGGYNLVLVARGVGKLRALAQALSTAHGIKTWVSPADLSQPDAARKLAAAMRRARRPIDVLVNNAGVLEFGRFIDMPAKRHGQLIDLNVAGLTAMLAYFLPPMVARREGRVLNVASIAAFQPVPSLATYAATKAYVLSLTESLSEELDGTGVTVTALCPGITATNMVSAVKKTHRELARLPDFVVGSAEAVADDGYNACLNGEVIRIPGVLNQAAILATRATPRWLFRRLSGAVVRRMR
jgi:short-subunit dehydrogenase